jgi:hypothetical protein
MMVCGVQVCLSAALADLNNVLEDLDSLEHCLK